MKTRRGSSFILSSLVLLFLLFIFWMTLAPNLLGGPVTYVIVDGNSMEPGFHRGDLVLVRTQASYEIGDVVVYQNAELQRYVFHRIVAKDLDRFVMQGDNNDWQDSYHPSQSEILGKLWVSFPKAGKVIEWLRVPLHLSVLIGIVGVLIMFDLFKGRSRNGKVENPSPRWNGLPEIAIYGFGILAVLFLAAGIFSFTRPLDQKAEDIPYQQLGAYSYSATGTSGVYDSNLVQSGEPIFPKLTCNLNLGFTYTLTGTGIQEVSGSYKMFARILDEQSGWQRTIPLTDETPFSGTSYFNMATLDLCQVESIVNTVEQETGLKSGVYTLEIVTDVVFTGNFSGTLVQDTFSPTLTFRYDKIHFYVPIDSEHPDPFDSSKAGIVSSSITAPNTISFLQLQIPVWTARFISLTGFVFSLLGLIVAGWTLYRLTSGDEAAMIRLKHGTMLADVFVGELPSASNMIDVNAIDDLARLAERHGTMILHMRRNFLHFYYVQGRGVLYRYVVSSGKREAHQETAEVPARNLNQPTTQPELMTPVRQKKLEANERRIVYVYAANETEMEDSITPSDLEQKDEQYFSQPEETVSYVIDTGEIEFTMPYEDTVVMKKVRFGS